MKKYEINEKTLALKPKEDKTLVLEEGNTFVADMPTNKIMEESCNYYGSSLEGRQEGASKLLNVSYKIPIIVEDVSNIIFFPTASPRKKGCIWISLNKIRDYYKENNNIVIVFKNGKQIKVRESYHIIDSQILKATRLGCVIQERLKKNTKKVKK